MKTDKAPRKVENSLYGILAQKRKLRNGEKHVILYKNEKKSWIFCRFTKNRKCVLL